MEQGSNTYGRQRLTQGSVSVQVAGRPRTKGSLKPVHRKLGPGRCAVSLTEDGLYSTPWKNEMIKAIREVCEIERFEGPVSVQATFRFERLASEERSATPWPTRQTGPAAHGDLDKLVRNVGDALTQAGLIKDDSQIVTIATGKYFVRPGEEAGVTIWVGAL